MKQTNVKNRPSKRSKNTLNHEKMSLKATQLGNKAQGVTKGKEDVIRIETKDSGISKLREDAKY